jgi:hypothetical protein
MDDWSPARASSALRGGYFRRLKLNQKRAKADQSCAIACAMAKNVTKTNPHFERENE